MSEPYAKSLIAKVKNIAAANAIKVHEGVYLGVTGPTFETRAEYKLIHAVGGDAVGMSTVQETIVAGAWWYESICNQCNYRFRYP